MKRQSAEGVRSGERRETMWAAVRKNGDFLHLRFE